MAKVKNVSYQVIETLKKDGRSVETFQPGEVREIEDVEEVERIFERYGDLFRVVDDNASSDTEPEYRAEKVGVAVEEERVVPVDIVTPEFIVDDGQEQVNQAVIEENERQEETTFVCADCGKVCASNFGLQAHKRSHNKK